MEAMRACACGERTKWTYAIPWRRTSSTKTPSPCTSRWSSLRGTFVPIQPTSSSVVIARSGVIVVSLMAHSRHAFRVRSGHGQGQTLVVSKEAASCLDLAPRGARDRLDDVHVARAAADIALDRLPDLVLCRLRIRVEEVLGAHQHPRRAVPALQRVMSAERPLQRMQLAISREALDRLDLRAVGLDREQHAGLHRVPVQQQSAGAAVACVAADMRPG